ncbi:MerR family transcriptional regulator [Microbacterium sp.]|uniref:MerR family transcriptional regulator n=1 Tax=Microbacterium sp. TaxID=51671 RepID=UPI003A8B2BBB
MRISELAAEADVPIATVKYYLREGLLPGGERTGATRAEYDASHVQRLGAIRALIDSGVSVADARAVLAAVDMPPGHLLDLLHIVHDATTPTVDAIDTAKAEQLARRMGWTEERSDPQALAVLAHALRRLDVAGFTIDDAAMSTYLDAVTRIARAEIAGIPTTSAEDAVRYVALGSVLVEPMLLALRRLAEQIEATRRFSP